MLLTHEFYEQRKKIVDGDDMTMRTHKLRAVVGVLRQLRSVSGLCQYIYLFIYLFIQ